MTSVQRTILANARRNRAWCIDCDWAEAPSTRDAARRHVLERRTHIVVHDMMDDMLTMTTVVRSNYGK